MAGSRGFSRGPRRKTSWEEGPGTNDVATLSSSSAVILGSGQEALVDGQTIVRIRGFVEIILTSAGALGDGFRGALGIGIVSKPAFLTGVVAVPTPITELEWQGWMWHQFFQLHAPTAAQVSENRMSFVIDTKAMRKIGLDEVLYASLEASETGVSGLKVILGTRMLLKLP